MLDRGLIWARLLASLASGPNAGRYVPIRRKRYCRVSSKRLSLCPVRVSDMLVWSLQYGLLGLKQMACVA